MKRTTYRRFSRTADTVAKRERKHRADPGPLEKEIEKSIGDYAKKMGCDFEKFVSPGRRGVSDRMITAPGGAIGFLEVKRKGKVPTKLQTARMARRKQMGCNVEWCDNVADGKAFVSKLVLIGMKLFKENEDEKGFWG